MVSVAVVSGKGGVGKTTLTANLGAALITQFKTGSILVDANLGAPSLGLHFGMLYFPKTLNQVIEGKAKITDVVYMHYTGIRIVPSELEWVPLKFNSARLSKSLKKLAEESFVLVDCAPGLGEDVLTVLKACDKVLIVMIPEYASLLGVKRLLSAVNSSKLVGIVLNRVRNRAHELLPVEIEKEIGVKIIQTIPEDELIPKALRLRQPAIILDPEATSSIAFKRVASKLLGKPYSPGLLRAGIAHDLGRAIKNLIINGLVIFRRL